METTLSDIHNSNWLMEVFARINSIRNPVSSLVRTQLFDEKTGAMLASLNSFKKLPPDLGKVDDSQLVTEQKGQGNSGGIEKSSFVGRDNPGGSILPFTRRGPGAISGAEEKQTDRNTIGSQSIAESVRSLTSLFRGIAYQIGKIEFERVNSLKFAKTFQGQVNDANKESGRENDGGGLALLYPVKAVNNVVRDNSDRKDYRSVKIGLTPSALDSTNNLLFEPPASLLNQIKDKKTPRIVQYQNSGAYKATGKDLREPVIQLTEMVHKADRGKAGVSLVPGPSAATIARSPATLLSASLKDVIDNVRPETAYNASRIPELYSSANSNNAGILQPKIVELARANRRGVNYGSGSTSYHQVFQGEAANQHSKEDSNNNRLGALVEGPVRAKSKRQERTLARVVNVNINRPMIEQFVIQTGLQSEAITEFREKVENVLLEILDSANAIN
jgi:hypothetical protein